MSGFSRRDLLRRLAAGTAAVAGTVVVLARSVVAVGAEPSAGTTAGPDERADRLAKELPAPPEGTQPVSFLNRAVAAGRGGVGGGGAFRNSGFANGRGGVGGGGAFRNGGFANGRGGVGGGGAFRNGAFRNF
jgi:hypothetical protein